MDVETPHSAFCPVYQRTVELIGRRWTGAILRALFSGVTRFSDLCETVPGLSDRMLAERLKELESEGIVRRTVILPSSDRWTRSTWRLPQASAKISQLWFPTMIDSWPQLPRWGCRQRRPHDSHRQPLACLAFGGEGLGSSLTQCRAGRALD